jgi:signal transduction histidine kinase
MTSLERRRELRTRMLPVLEEVLSAIVDLQNANLACVQLYRLDTRSLEIVAQRGFRQDFIDYAANPVDQGTVWGRAAMQRARIMVEDIWADASFAPQRPTADAAGYRAAQSTPLFSHGGELLGVITTFFREPHQLTPEEFRFTDRYARLAAELIEHQDSGETLHTGLSVLAESETAALKIALAEELIVMTRLHDFSTRLLASTEVQTLLEEALLAVIAIQKADFGILHLYNPRSGELEIVAQHGFRQHVMDYFAAVRDAGTAFRRAMIRSERVMIEDVETDPEYEPHRANAASAGFRSVQSTPLFIQNGELLGMISTYFRGPHRPSEHELRLTDLYAVHAAQIIERESDRAALRRYQQELRALTARLIEVQEAQTKHLARELHDAFGQKLAILGIEMAALAQRLPESSEIVRSRLGQLTEQIGELSKDIHQISRQLHPSILDDLGLEAALRNECMAFSEQHHIRAEFEPVAVPREIPDDVSLCLYRAAQECLRNVASHANATSVLVALNAGCNEIELKITDKGDGFDLGKIKGQGGLGLISMDERARLVDGRFSIRSEPGNGTIVNIRVPLYKK